MSADLEVGQSARRSLAVTAGVVRAYAELTGDFNPLHFDEGFARGTRFGGLIAQGGIATGLLHALVAMDLPGPGSVFVKQSWTFPAPAHIGDTLTAEGTVTSIHPRRGFIEMAFTVTNQEGRTVLRGEATLVREQPSES